MENLIFTINGNKPGELVHFEVEFEKGNSKTFGVTLHLLKQLTMLSMLKKKGFLK